MCRVKKYSEKMRQYLTAALLRLDTFLLYDDFLRQPEILRKLFGGHPSSPSFNDLIAQAVDVDSVADLHGTYINKVLDSELIFLEGCRLAGKTFNIFVNTYFIAFDITDPGSDLNDLIGDIVGKYLTVSGLSLSYAYLRLNYSVDRKKADQLWQICDRSAFPLMEGGEYTGQYTDSREIENIFMDLSRFISPSEKGSEQLDVTIQTKAVISIGAENNVADDVMSALAHSEIEVTRCFKE